LKDVNHLACATRPNRPRSASVLSLNYRDTLRFKRRPSPLMGEGLGGGAGAGGKALQRITLTPREPISCRCFVLVPRSSMDRVYEIWMSGAAIWAGITLTQSSPIKGEGFRQQLSAVACWLFFAVLARCSWLLFVAGACQKARVSAPRHASWLYFCGIYSGISDARALQRRIRQARARACSNAAQTRRWAFIASSTAGTMPKKAWIIPGNSLYSTGTPAHCSASAYR
jgi:hypothetical protein